MNGRIIKRIKKAVRKSDRQYLREIKAYPLINRLRLCWWLIFGKPFA